MNECKIKKFLNKFNIDYCEMKIIKCPNLKEPFSSEYDEKNSLLKAYFNKDDCDKCRYRKKCIKENYDNDYYQILIKSDMIIKKVNNDEHFKSEYNLRDYDVEQLILKQMEMEIGDIRNTKKCNGKKYEDGELSYDGEYLEANSFMGVSWYCHGYGKNYYDGKSVEYEGYFKYGHPHGEGKYYYRNGKLRWDGIFEAIPGIYPFIQEAINTSQGYVDRRGRIKYGKAYRENGTLEYDGEFNLGIPNGEGKLYDDNEKLICVGIFKDGELIGENKLNITTQNVSKVSSYTQDKFTNMDDEFVVDENGLRYIGMLDEVIIPEFVDGKIIDKIAPEGFRGKNIKKVVLPNTLKVIGKSAFADCSELIEIKIPDSVTNIESWAFGACSSLEKIELCDNVIEIGSHAFDECYKLEKIILPKKINYIGAYAFSETALKEITLPEGIKYLANSLFYNCCNLRQVVIKEGLETIGISTFENCCKLEKVNLEDSIKVIACDAFKGCVSLVSIRIPKNLNEMAETAFRNCVNLHEVKTDDINRKIIKYNNLRKIYETFGITENDRHSNIEYDTLYNMLKRCTNKQLKVIELKKIVDDNKSYIDILNDGVKFKREGKYEDAKSKYIQAIKLKCKEPKGYYNLGKVLYILGDFNASVKSYKTAFELGMDPCNVLIHLGHALLDPNGNNDKYQSAISFYERGINPYLITKYADDVEQLSKIFKNQPTNKLLDEYEKKCIEAAKKYLGIN